MSSIGDKDTKTELQSATTEADEKVNVHMHEDVNPSPDEIRKLLRKQDVVLMPTMMLLYLFYNLGGITIGNSKLAGLMSDIDISENQFNWAVSIYYFGFILFDVPSNMILQKVGAQYWLSLAMLLSAVILGVTATIHNGAGLIATRFFLGIVQASFFPGIVLHISTWYTRRELGVRMAFFLLMGAVGSAVGGILAYGIMYMDGTRNLRAWRWLYIIIGLSNFVVACIVFLILPTAPERSKRFLTEREKKVAVCRLLEDSGTGPEQEFSWKQCRRAFFDWKLYILAFLQLIGLVPNVSLRVFTPSIINGMGFTELAAQGLSAPPFVASAIAMVIICWNSDRVNERAFHSAMSSFVGAIGYLLLIVLKDHGPVALYISSVIAIVGVLCASPPRVTWVANTFGDRTKRGVAIAFASSCSSIGSVIGGQVYRADDAPFYTRGHAIALSFSAATGIMALMIKYLFHRENVRRSQMSPEEYQKHAQKTGDEHPSFCFTL
ncbi:major facilitator superfamily domain-containing protein [Fennellomyces sp. T-0311]|nr:major facilitator superfamily domain-containing protein [Fennellomyces sp. T-0311]